MTRLTLWLALATASALGNGCAKPPPLPPDMTCEALEAEREDADRKVRALAGDTVDMDTRDFNQDVYARSYQGDEEWRQAKRLREAEEHLEAVEAAIAERCPATDASTPEIPPPFRGGFPQP